MKISIYVSGIKVSKWQSMYDALATSTVPFELIVVGPLAPDHIMPENFKFILSDVKPAQAVEIARRQCTGDFLMNLPDDLQLPLQMLDRLVTAYEQSLDKQIIITPMFGIDGNILPKCAMYYNVNDLTSPIMSVGSFMSRELHDKIGGLDRNFVAIYWDLDIVMRVYELGGHVVLLDDLVVSESTLPTDAVACSLSTRFSRRDRDYLTELWGDGKTFTRRRALEPYQDENLTTINQGRV